MDAPLRRIESLKTLHRSTSSAKEVYSNTPWRYSVRSSLKFTLRRFLLRASCVRERGKEISKDREECTRIRNDATKYRWRRIVRHAGARVSRKTYNRRSRYIHRPSCIYLVDNAKRWIVTRVFTVDRNVFARLSSPVTSVDRSIGGPSGVVDHVTRSIQNNSKIIERVYHELSPPVNHPFCVFSSYLLLFDRS